MGDPSGVGIPAFEAHVLETGLTFAAGVFAIADIDGDGANDFVGGGNDPRIWWTRHDAWGGTKHPVAVTAGVGYEIHAADVDNDGDLDVLSSGAGVTWWENPRPGTAPDAGAWIEHSFGSDGTAHNGGSHDFKVGDIDGNGWVDAVERAQNSVPYLIYLQRTGGTGWDSISVDASRSGEGTALGDIDGDGDLDLSDGWAWFECPADPINDSWIQHDVGDATHNLTRVVITDINGDGDPDIVSSPSEYGGSQLIWFEAPPDPTGTWTAHVVYEQDDPNLHTLQTGDIDNDGDLDILSGQTSFNDRRKLMVFLNPDGQGTVPWHYHEWSVTDGVWQGVMGDVSSDGDLDVVFSDYPAGSRSEFWENIGPSVGPIAIDAWTYILADGAQTDGAAFGLAAGDFNGDGFADVVTGQHVHLNPAGVLDGAWSRVDLPVNDVLVALQVDGDARPEALAVNPSGVFLLRATDAGATTWSSTQVSDQGASDHSLSTQGYATGDLIAGGHDELVYSTHHSGVLLLDSGGAPDTLPWSTTSIYANYSEGLAIADVDGDGDNDVVGGDDAGAVYWLENPGWTAHTIGTFTGAIDRVDAGDLDGDGDVDVVITEEQGGASLTVLEQPDGTPTAGDWTAHALATATYGFLSMHVADFDGDGRLDVVAARSTDPNRIAIWRNRGSWTFTDVEISNPDNKQSHLGCLPVDLDNDGDLDLVSISWTAQNELYVYRNDD